MPINIDGREIDTLSLLFADVRALIEVMDSLTNNYRLMVGAAEELTRTPGVGQQTINLALDRVDNTGTLLDLIIFTLAVKMDFLAEVLSVTGIPLDLLIAALVKSLQTEEKVPRDPCNLIPRPKNPFCPCGYRQTTLPLNQRKWERRFKQWEARKKRWESRRLHCGKQRFPREIK